MLRDKNGEEFARLLPPDEQDRDRVYLRMATDYIRNHPGRDVALTLRRLWHYVWLDPTHPLAGNPCYRIPYMVLFCVSVPTILLSIRRRDFDPAIGFVLVGSRCSMSR